jgi:hypothetical protein
MSYASIIVLEDVFFANISNEKPSSIPIYKIDFGLFKNNIVSNISP